MLPFLFTDTVFETPTYYLLYFLAFLGAIILASNRAQSYSLKPVRAIDLGIWCFVGGFLGARFFHIIFEAPSYYLERPLRIFYFWQGGFVLFGGILVGILAGYLFLKSKDEPIGRWADLAAPSLLLGIGIGRVGCLAVGCCYGTVTDWWWGMVFSDPRSAAPLHISLHPTQFLESLFGFISALIFLIIFRKPPSRPGFAFVCALLVYSVFRFFIEFLRGDQDRGLYFSGMISTSQIISLVTVLACLVWIYLRRTPQFLKTTK